MGGTFTLNFNEETSEFSKVEYSKTPSDFLSHSSYNIPKYAVWTSGSVSGEAKRTTTIPKGSMTIQINGIQLLHVDSQIVNDYATFSQDFDTTKGKVFSNNENGYLTLSGDAIWTVTATAATPYIKNQKITVNYDYPKFTVLATAKDLKGNAQGGTITGGGVVEITQKGQQKTLTLTATAGANYNFVGWEDDDSLGPTRTITLNESELTSSNTQITYTALLLQKNFM